MESSLNPNELLPLLAIGIGLMLMLAMAFVLFFSFSQNKLRQEQFNAQEAKIAYQENLLYSTIRTQEKERERIAKDLHDEIGSKLNVIHLFLHGIRKKAPEATDKVEDLTAVLNDTIQTTRRISHDLLPPTLEKFGLQTAIEELIERFQQANQQKVNLEIVGKRSDNIEKIVELNLFRVLFELINNTLKYAEADQIDIKLIQTEEKIALEYRDNGRGFDSEAEENQKGLGMKNIQSRLQMINGQYDLQSKEGEGMEIKIGVELNSKIKA